MTNQRWRPSTSKYGVAISSFTNDGQNFLSLEIGETVQILEEYLDEDDTATWYLGCLFGNKNKKGIFPCSYICVKECVVENEGPYETVTPLEDAVVKELTFVLREWLERWKSLFVNCKKTLNHSIWLVMGELVKYRCTLVSDTLTKEQALELKQTIVTIIDWGNANLGMDLVPRVEYKQAEPDKVSVVEMYRIHQKSVEDCEGVWLKLEEPSGKVTAKKKNENQGEMMQHILVEFCSFACSVADYSEVVIALYDNNEPKSTFLSEKFVAYVDKDGKWERQANNNAPSTIFTDLSLEDTHRDLYLVIQILRRGRLLVDSGTKKMQSQHFRRPWGVSVLSLRDFFQIRPENGMVYPIRVQCVDTESQFSSMHETLIKRQTQMTGRGASTDKQNQALTLSVKLLCGELKNAKISHPLLVNKGMVLTPRLGFSDFITPGEVRNDLYLTLSGAELDRGSKTASKNVEVQVTVYNDQYQIIDECISSATNLPMTSNYFSSVIYHTNSPRWNETIRLSIPVEKFKTSHIRLELSHCSSQDKQAKKLFGFAFLDLTPSDNVTRHDSSYDLCVYKVEDYKKIKNYLNYPALQDDFNDPRMMPTIPSNVAFARSNREYVTVKTFLCSSKFAQKSELLSVLQWSSLPPKAISTSLENLVTLRGQELFRYLQDVLDALFDMFSAGNGTRVSYAMSIFRALLHIFNLLQEEMFDKFACVVEDYLEKSFSSPLAHRDMLFCLDQMVEQIYRCTDFDEKNETKRVFKVIEDVFKFAVKSCMLAQRLPGDSQLNEFHENLNTVFTTFGKMLSCSEQVLHKAQNQLLTNIHKCYAPLLLILTPDDLTSRMLVLMSKIPKDAPSPVLKGKTQLIKNTICSPLFTKSESRNLLLPRCLAHLKRCFIQQRHLLLSTNTFADLLSCIFSLKQTADVQEEITKIIQGMFDVTVRTLWNLSPSEPKEVRSLLTSCMTEMLRLMSVQHYQKLIGDYPKHTPLKDFLNRVLLVFKELVTTDIYPSDWTTMRMITNNVMLISIQYIGADLADNFMQEGEFNRELWTNFFLLAVSFITQPALQLEKYSEAKSGQIKDRYNDMRINVGCQTYSLWNKLDTHTEVLMMDLIGPFLRVTMIPEPEVRKATIPIFFDMMRSEYGKNEGDLRQLEGKMLYELDYLVLEHHGDTGYKDLLTAMLLDKLQTEPAVMQEEGNRFVSSVTDLLERLLDYRDIMDSEEKRDMKMHCTFNILNFYKDSREDMYVRYITRLYELHYTASNFVEAGLTLRLYAQLLTWSNRVLPAEISFATQSEGERKEELFTIIIDCFDKGKSWEYGIPLCKELAEHYENTFQYQKLGEILQKQATFLYHILESNKLRQNPTYYRVAYYGNSFPPYLKNKAFIYRGDEYLQLTSMISQLRTEYPLAKIPTDNSPIDEACKHGDDQYIQIVSVKPVAPERPMFAGKTVPPEISQFYTHNEVDTFRFDRPYYREGKDKQNEFKSLCLERVVLKTRYSLPGILRWYEVVDTQTLHLCPVQTATDTVQQMNAELRSSTEKAATDLEQNLRHLCMRLQGVISGAVNGGIPKYQEAFFNEEYKSKYPLEVEYIEDLKAAIMEQLNLLERGLKFHGKHVSVDMQPLHKSMVDGFDKMRTSMGYQSSSSTVKSRGSSVISLGLSSNRPSTPSSTSLNSSGSNRSSVVSATDVAVMGEYNDLSEVEVLTPTSSSPFNMPAIMVSALPPYQRKRSVSMRGTPSSFYCPLPTSSPTSSSLSPASSSSSSTRPHSANLGTARSKQLPLPSYVGSRAESQPCLGFNNNEMDELPPKLPERKKSLSEGVNSLGLSSSVRSPSTNFAANQPVSPASNQAFSPASNQAFSPASSQAFSPPPIPRRRPGSTDSPTSYLTTKSKSESDGGDRNTLMAVVPPPRPPRSAPLPSPHASASTPPANYSMPPPSHSPPPPAIPPLPAKRSVSTSSASSITSTGIHYPPPSSPAPAASTVIPPPSPTAFISLDYSTPPPSFDEAVSMATPFNNNNAEGKTLPPPPPSKREKPAIPQKLSLTPDAAASNTSGISGHALPDNISPLRPPPRTPTLRGTPPSTVGGNSDRDGPPPLPQRKTTRP